MNDSLNLKKLNPDQIGQIYSELKIQKTHLGRDYIVINKIISAIDKLINSAKEQQENIEIKSHIASYRNEIQNLLERNVTDKVDKLLDQLNASTFLSIDKGDKPEQFEEALILLEKTEKWDKDLTAYSDMEERFGDKQTKKSAHWRSTLETIKTKSAECIKQVIQSADAEETKVVNQELQRHKQHKEIGEKTAAEIEDSVTAHQKELQRLEGNTPTAPPDYLKKINK